MNDLENNPTNPTEIEFNKINISEKYTESANIEYRNKPFTEGFDV